MRIEGFEKWLLTARGRGCLTIKDLKNQEYLKNRLWWAYYAGNTAKDISLTSEVQLIFEELVKLPKNRTVPLYLKKRIEYVMQHKEDYTLTKTPTP